MYNFELNQEHPMPNSILSIDLASVICKNFLKQKL